MTYRGSLPPGQAFQGQPEQPFAQPHMQQHGYPQGMHPQQQPQQQHHHHPQQHQQHMHQQQLYAQQQTQQQRYNHHAQQHVNQGQMGYGGQQFFPAQGNPYVQQAQQGQGFGVGMYQDQQFGLATGTAHSGYGNGPEFGYHMQQQRPQQQQRQQAPQQLRQPQQTQQHYPQPQQMPGHPIPGQLAAPSEIWHNSMQQLNTQQGHQQHQSIYSSSPRAQQTHVPSPSPRPSSRQPSNSTTPQSRAQSLPKQSPQIHHQQPQFALQPQHNPDPHPPEPYQQPQRTESSPAVPLPPQQPDQLPPNPLTEHLVQEPVHFVNLQDIQRMPEPPPPSNVLSPERISAMVPPKKPAKRPEGVSDANIKLQNRPEPTTQPRVRSSPHSSISNSPALSSKSPSITKKSPAIPSKSRPVNTTPILMSVAEECIGKARGSSHNIAMSLDAEQVDEYQKLISTGLACLESMISSGKLSPREEARIRLRYAAVVQEDTEDIIQAETALSKGISLCDQHRLLDLKYCMQHVLLRALFDRNRKAALTAVDKNISDCEAFKHVHWVYAFRLLKASFYMEMGHASDASAFDNLRTINYVAVKRGDIALAVYTSLLEGLAHLRTGREDSIVKVRECVAQAAKYQADPSVQIDQLDLLTMLLDVASTLDSGNFQPISKKLRALQKRLDECNKWKATKSDFLIPIKRMASSAKTVSSETAGIVRLGDTDSETDFLVMSFLTKIEMNTLVFIFSGLVNMYKVSTVGRRSNDLWEEARRILESWDDTTVDTRYGAPISLKAALRQRAWRTEAQSYVNLLLGLLAASTCHWDMVKEILNKLNNSSIPPTYTTLKALIVYLKGVYHQGTGDIKTAVRIFSSSHFEYPTTGAGIKSGLREVALLAGMNQLWIMQHPSCRDNTRTADLIDQLQPLCSNHPNVDLRVAWHNIMSALVTEPKQLLNVQKSHMSEAVGGIKTTNNVLEAAITLCIMRSRFFEGVVGEQALKSSLAAAAQASKSGNLLWRSVADGLLAHNHETQGNRDQAAVEWQKAIEEAKGAFSMGRE